MYVRLTYCKFLSDSIKGAKKIYREEIIPTVKKQKGNIGVHLFEPVDKSDDFISVTQWESKADADAYEASGVYKGLIRMLEDFFSKEPVLKTYVAEESLIVMPER